MRTFETRYHHPVCDSTSFRDLWPQVNEFFSILVRFKGTLEGRSANFKLLVYELLGTAGIFLAAKAREVSELGRLFLKDLLIGHEQQPSVRPGSCHRHNVIVVVRVGSLAEIVLFILIILID